MLITLIRVSILYCIVMIAVRLMGKRQVGELQPTELVVTILLSELVAIPIQDNSLPMATSLISAAALVAFEILSSILAVRSNKFRTLTQGHSLLVIRGGKPDLRQLKNLRISLDDLMEALRQKDIFDLNDVEYCFVETTGKISVLPKPAMRGASAGELNPAPAPNKLPFVMIYDGQEIPRNFGEVGMTQARLQGILHKQKVQAKDLMLLTVTTQGEVFCLRKEGLA
ncbi:MAG: DUF421 domain-containing protein [Oscillospiraceae bacterium]|jgi:uncharacterized membrane protein YcaP (DUF421 family)|nr:DUF421 domain-containing protein [Oscillospiraceae bacterium]